VAKPKATLLGQLFLDTAAFIEQHPSKWTRGKLGEDADGNPIIDWHPDDKPAKRCASGWLIHFADVRELPSRQNEAALQQKRHCDDRTCQ
jgi:hypothetical protein